MWIRKLKSRGFKSGDFLGPTPYVGVPPVLRSLSRKCQHCVLLEDAIWFLSGLLDSWKNFRLQNFFCKRQRLACAPFKPSRRHFLPVQCYDAKNHDCGRMLSCWHSAVFRDIISKRYDLIILFVEDIVNGEIFLIALEKSESSILVILQVTQQTGAPLQTLLNHCWFLKRLRLFPLVFLTIQGTVKIEIFFFNVSLVIFWHMSFAKIFLMASEIFLIEDDPLATLRPPNVVPPNEQSFSWLSAVLKSMFPWSSSVTKWIFRFF